MTRASGPIEVEPLPERLGRFEVTGRLGEGGMGQVLRARDPKLDREVAIKLLRADVDDERAPLRAEVARQRLVREAQAMARLDHPNVIGVHEVGEDGGRVFLVMERVAGTTLAGWLRGGRRSWREVLAVFAQAGAGIAAAHAAGLVHRDIKPDNVLVGDDGRVRVTDFGLVGVEIDAAVAAAADDAPEIGSGPPAVALTHEGAMVGTPGYMAPEQVRGHAADARSDQFGLCVSLYEALYGEAPFAGETFRALAVAVLDGQVRPAPAGSDVPEAVRAIVLRGLAVDPQARWPDVAALLDALAATTAAPVAALSAAVPASRRGAWLAAAAGVIALGGGAAWYATRDRGRASLAAPAATSPPPRDAPSLPVPPAAVETLVSSGACDGVPVLVDDHTMVYRHVDRSGYDLRVRDLKSGADRALTTTPEVDEMSPQAVIGERAVVVIPKHVNEGGAGTARIDVDSGRMETLPAGANIFFNPGAILAGGAIYHVVGGGTSFVEMRDGVTTERAGFPGSYIFDIAIDSEVRTAVLSVSGRGLCLVDLRTRGEPRCLEGLDTPYGRPTLDDAGRLYYAGPAGLRRRDLSTGKDELLVADRGVNGGMVASRDGRTLIWSECQPQIAITATESGKVAHAESMTGANVDRHGTWAFIRETPSASLVAFLDAGGIVQVLTRPDQGTAAQPVIEPDGGQRIVFALFGKEPGLYLARGHRPIRLITKKEMAQSVWIDDGHIAATLLHPDGLPYVHIVNVDSGEDRQALTAPRQTMDRQPDGSLVLLASDDRARLFLWDPTTATDREITLPREVSKRTITQAALAPGAREVELIVGSDVWRVAIDGTSPAQKVYTPPARRSFWGMEIDAAGVRHAFLGEDKGDIYKVSLPP